jgi:thiol:disulfide interchange protein DsbC
MTRSLFALLAAVLVAALGLAAGSAAAKDETTVRKAAEAFVGPEMRVDAVARADFLGFWEIRVVTPEGTRLLYTNDEASHFFIGAVIDGKTQTDLTEARMRKLNAIRFADLPLNQAFKIVRGKGTRQLAYFSDPRCGYCRRFDQEIVKMDDVTVHVFMLPIIAPDSGSISRAVWCSPDRAKAWLDWMLKEVAPAAGSTCANPVERNLELGKKLRISGTPTLFFVDGQRISGWRPAPELSKLLDEAQARK